MKMRLYYVIKAKVKVGDTGIKDCYLSNSMYSGGIPVGNACWATGINYATKFDSLANARDSFKKEKLVLMSKPGFIVEKTSVKIVKITTEDVETLW